MRSRMMPLARATSRMRGSGPTRIGVMMPKPAAATAPSSDDASQGCATAVATGSRCRQRSSSRSYLPVPTGRSMNFLYSCGAGDASRRPGFVEEEGEHDGERDPDGERRERTLIVLEPHR